MQKAHIVQRAGVKDGQIERKRLVKDRERVRREKELEQGVNLLGMCLCRCEQPLHTCKPALPSDIEQRILHIPATIVRSESWSNFRISI